MSDRSLIGLLRRHHMWIPLLPVTMAMAVLLAGAVLDRTVDAFDGQGLRANATVLNARTAEMQGPDGMPTPRYRLLVRFLPARGDAVEAWHDVNRAVFDSATVGQILPVRYVPNSPATAEIIDDTTRGYGWLTWSIGVLLLLAGSGAALVIGRDLPSARRAQQSTRRQTAFVQTHQYTGTKLGDIHLHRMIWTDEQGRPGRSRARKPGDLPAIGKTIVLRADPRTGRLWWEGDL